MEKVYWTAVVGCCICLAALIADSCAPITPVSKVPTVTQDGPPAWQVSDLGAYNIAPGGYGSDNARLYQLTKPGDQVACYALAYRTAENVTAYNISLSCVR